MPLRSPPQATPSGTSDDVATACAPPFRSLIRPERVGTRPRRATLPDPPSRIGDFEVLGVLGEGGFATVYLARQISLDRRIALKVSVNSGDEARTLAALDHDHIVHIFSEAVEGGLRLLCMQYVPGATLASIVKALQGRKSESWCGRDLLDAIDAATLHPGDFNPSALRDRESLAQADSIQATCSIGASLAEALAYAHGRGILHRDVKPDNILINPYGRAMLADFNLSLDLHRRAEVGGELFGGTLPYMAPEHLDALSRDAPRNLVDERSDVYSLGAVLFELLSGARPFGDADPLLGRTEALRAMAAERRAGAPSLRQRRPDTPEAVDRVIRRSLEPDPARRYPTAGELARALIGCRELRRIHRELPPAGPMTRAAVRRPFLWLILVATLPQVLGSMLNVPYNLLQIFPDPGTPRRAAFFHLVGLYNALVYPLCLGMAYRLIVPVYRVWRTLLDGRPVRVAQVDAARRRVVSWPLWAAALSCLGWIPGGLLFPLGLGLLGHRVDLPTLGHLLVSFWISGLIALTYSFFAIQYVALRVLYPRLWVDAAELRPTARRELGRLGCHLRTFQLLAALIPLAGATLLVGLGPDVMTRPFRLLTTALIVAGMAGIGPTIMITTVLNQMLAVLARSEPRPG